MENEKMTHIVYRVEFTAPVHPSKCWEKCNAIMRQELNDIQWSDLGFDRDDICSVEWQESPTLAVELWRTLEGAIATHQRPVITQRDMDNVIQIAINENWPRSVG